jgi:hypothetical protein
VALRPISGSSFRLEANSAPQVVEVVGGISRYPGGPRSDDHPLRQRRSNLTPEGVHTLAILEGPKDALPSQTQVQLAGYPPAGLINKGIIGEGPGGRWRVNERPSQQLTQPYEQPVSNHVGDDLNVADLGFQVSVTGSGLSS